MDFFGLMFFFGLLAPLIRCAHRIKTDYFLSDNTYVMPYLINYPHVMHSLVFNTAAHMRLSIHMIMLRTRRTRLHNRNTHGATSSLYERACARIFMQWSCVRVKYVLEVFRGVSCVSAGPGRRE